MRASVHAVLLALAAPCALGLATARQHEATSISANPIRKVVTMLQHMQQKVTEEGKKEEELFHKFMCYCKTNNGALDASIQEAKNKIESTEAALQAGTEKRAQTEQDLKAHQQARSDAKEAIAESTRLREKEAAAYATLAAENKANIGALTKAIGALERGTAGGFLQTKEAQSIRRLALDKAEMPDGAREAVLSFLSGTSVQGYAPKSGQIIGILKQLLDSLVKGDADVTATEQSAIASYKALMDAKKKEIEALTSQIEEEQLRLGELGIFLATAANDIKATKRSLDADSQFKLELAQSCSTKEAEWDDIVKTRSEELLALAETIKALNDDDALDLFNKALPAAGKSFVQLQVRAAAVKANALAALREAERPTAAAARLPVHPELDLIELALSGKKIGFDKVLALIDDLVANLHKEQAVDDSKKEFCEAQLDASEDKQKELERSVSDSEAAIEEIQGSIQELKESIQALQSGLRALDKSVAEATAQREQEHAEFVEAAASDNAAKELLLWAKNRLHKFYNPKLYKEEAKAELSAQGRIMANMGVSLLQVAAHHGEAPPPPPEAPGPYSKKSQESTGVMAMMDLIIADLDKELQESQVAEKNSQKTYEKFMDQSAKKRAADSAALTEKESSVAAREEALQAEKDKKSGSERELQATLGYIHSLHNECDWLLQYFSVRKEAREAEIDALEKAKAVLHGADYSLVQTQARSTAVTRGFLSVKA